MATETSTNESQLRQQLTDAQQEIERLRRQLDREVGTLNNLIQLSTLLNSTLDVGQLLPLIMKSAQDLLDAEACSIMLIDEPTGDLLFEVALGEKSGEVVKQRIPMGQGIAGHVAQTGEPMIINSVKDEPSFYDRMDAQVGFQTRNMLAVPLRLKARVIGVVEIINLQGRDRLAEKDLELASALTHLAAVAIDNARLYQKMADALVTSRMSYRL
jgi:phosphoserine phosphatase RsbU/P